MRYLESKFRLKYLLSLWSWGLMCAAFFARWVTPCGGPPCTYSGGWSSSTPWRCWLYSTPTSSRTSLSTGTTTPAYPTRCEYHWMAHQLENLIFSSFTMWFERRIIGAAEWSRWLWKLCWYYCTFFTQFLSIEFKVGIMTPFYKY